MEVLGTCKEQPRSQDIMDHISFYDRRLKCLESVKEQITDLESDDPAVLLKSSMCYSIKHRKRIRLYIDFLSVYKSMKSTYEWLVRRAKIAALNAERIVESSEAIESEMKSGMINDAVIEQTENLTDVGGNDVDNRHAGATKDDGNKYEGMLSMDDFLSRPVQLIKGTIPLNTDVLDVYSLWDLMTLEPSIRAKLRNYAFFRGDLVIKVSVSGTPFHYGRILLSYQPLAGSNQTLETYNTSLTTVSAVRESYINYLSQAPGAVSVDVKQNTPTVIRCPFILPKPLARLYNDTTAAIADTTSLEDFKHMGDLYFATINQIKSTSATPSVPYFEIYAWFENVQLSTPTGTRMEITTEADEREVGPMEKVASYATQVADALTVVPPLAPYATASSMISRGLGNLAALFGFSRPIQNKESTLMKNMPYRNTAYTIGYDTNYKLTLDPKQEVTIDPRVTGSTEDEMTMAHICARESYLTTFSWNNDFIPMLFPMWSSMVLPHLYTSITSGLIERHQPTALAFAAQVFDYWRGDITFRFEIVCSQYHKGRIAFYFEPNMNQSGLITQASYLNKQYMKIIDIQETQSVEFCVKWAQAREWLFRTIDYIGVYGANGVGINYGDYNGRANGMIHVVPFTALQSPDNSDVQINVYVKSDNIRFNALTERTFPDDRTVITESGYYDELIADDVTCMDLNMTNSHEKNIAMDYFGEQPVSFRTLMKRYAYQVTLTVPASVDSHSRIDFQLPIVPDNELPYGTTNTASKNLFTYLRYAYLGLRGGVRRKVVLNTNGASNPFSNASISLNGASGATSTSASVLSFGPIYSYLRGTAMFVANSNGGIEVETPYYTNNSFLISFADDLVGDLTNVMETFFFREFDGQIHVSSAHSNSTITEHVAASDDFSFLRFQGAPYFTK